MPVSSPRPRIMIGGGGERKTLRLVAQYADACNIFGGPDEVAHKLDVLRRHCDALGRDPNEIEVTVMYRDFPPDTTTDDLLRGAEAFANIGVSTLVTGAVGDDPGGLARIDVRARDRAPRTPSNPRASDNFRGTHGEPCGIRRRSCPDPPIRVPPGHRGGTGPTCPYVLDDAPRTDHGVRSRCRARPPHPK